MINCGHNFAFKCNLRCATTVWRYHVLYVYERGYESNGSMWFSVVELMTWSLLIAQSFTSCVLFSKAAWTPGGARPQLQGGRPPPGCKQLTTPRLLF